MWCDHKKGCDDAGDFGSKVYPYHGCQLMQLPKDVEPQHWDRGPMFSSFQMGYITGEHAHNMCLHCSPLVWKQHVLMTCVAFCQLRPC